MKWLDRLFVAQRSLLVWHGSPQQRPRVRCLGVGFLALGFVLFLGGCVSSIRFQTGSDEGTMIDGFFFRPEGTGPFPAMVLLHTCGGIRPHVYDWAWWLKAQGYVALAVDSFSPRGIINCKGEGAAYFKFDIAWDAIGALAYLRSLPFVDEERIGVMGWSLGADEALVTTNSNEVGLVIPKRYSDSRFRVAVAFYPSCNDLPAEPAIPILLLLGEIDTWTPPFFCVTRAKLLQQEGRKVFWKVYPGAHHGFDQDFPSRVYLGHTLEYDGAATADSEKRVRAFLAQYLRGAKSEVPTR